jgi:mono/diheme cytochrome c family protein
VKTLLVVIAAGVLSTSARGQRTESNEQTFLSHNDVTSGAELFRLYCATCHGVDGRGDGPAAPALKRRPPDLTTISERNGGRFPEFRITHIIDGYEITASHGSREMPIWGDFFHDMKRDDTQLKLREHNLTEYIRSIQK